MIEPTLKQECGLWVLRNDAGSILWKENDGTKVKGVTYDKRTGKYLAQIRYKGKNKNLGYFDTQEQAARKYNSFKQFVDAEKNEPEIEAKIEMKNEVVENVELF